MLKTLFKNTQYRRKRPEINMLSKHEERKVNRLDLFFDLVFVITIGQLAHLFHGEITYKLIIEFVILFVPVWRLWIASTYYVARFEEQTVRHRVYMMLLMIPVLGLGYSIHGAIGELAVRYVGSYVLARSLLAYMWYSGGKSQTTSQDLKKLTSQQLLFNGFIIALWIGSLFVEGPWRYLIWFFSMFLELGLGWFNRSDTKDDIPDFHMGHLSERFGLFTIIVLAEIIIGVFSGLSHSYDITTSTIITSIATFLIACLLWWIYFDQIMSRPMKETEGDHANMFLRTYGHLPLTLGITAIGGTLSHIIESHDHLSELTMGVIVIGLCIILLTIGWLAQYHQGKTEDGTVDLTHKEDELNKHLFLTKAIASLALLIRGGVWMHSTRDISRFVIGVVIILGGLAMEGVMYWVDACLEE